MKNRIPEFVIAGHPNEGKSSVLSTLAEDDSVRISPIPGETRECRTFPVLIDGSEIIRFIDTPGFQNPRRTLQWMQSYIGPDHEMIPSFIEAHSADPAFRDDCELLAQWHMRQALYLLWTVHVPFGQMTGLRWRYSGLRESPAWQ